MLNGKLTCLFAIIQIISTENQTETVKNLFLVKLLNSTRQPSGQFFERKFYDPETRPECTFKSMNAIKSQFLGRTLARFTDQGTNSSKEDNQMEAPAGKFSLLNLLSEDEEDDGDDPDNDQEEPEEEEEDDDEEDDEVKDDKDGDDGDVLNFFGDFEESDVNKQEGSNDLLKQYHRNRLRMQNLLLPLLLAYKLKFVAVIPMLLGSLVLLAGTTGLAGFFFALFAAALGIHVKTQQT